MIASLEFAATGFETPLLVVMGHTGCGAVQAAVDAHRKGKDAQFASPFLKHLIGHIQPAAEACAHDSHLHADGDDHLNQVTWANVENSIDVLLKSSQLLAGLVKQGKLMVFGSLFNLETSQAEFRLDPEISLQVEETIRHRLIASMTALETSSSIPHRRVTG
jgi:carbonic anhydrase